MIVRVLSIISKFRQSEFLRHNAIFFFGSVAVGALNYLYYPVVGRLLEPAVFGEVQALVSLFIQLTVFLSVFSLITINVIANYKDSEKAKRVVFELEKTALSVSMIALTLVAVASPQLQNLLQFESPWPFIALALALVASLPLTFRGAYLRGVKKFGQASIANGLSAAGKLCFSVLFILLGFGTLGAIGGLVIAQLIAFWYAATFARKHGLIRVLRYWKKPDLQSIVPELRYALLVFVGSFGIALLYSADALIVKYLFDAHTAGLYAGVATVARILFFLTASIAQVLLPSVKLQQTSQNQAVLKKSLLLTVVISAPILLACTFFPEVVIKLLMGREYLELASLLPPLTMAVFLISIANLFVLYHVALRHWAVAWIVIIDMGVALVLVAENHGSPQAIVDNLLISSVTLLVLLGIWMLSLTNRNRRTAKLSAKAVNFNHSSRL